MNSIDSDIFFMEQQSSEPSPQGYNFPNILNSTELSKIGTTDVPTVSSVTSPERDIASLDDNSNDPTFPYGFGAQPTIALPSINDLNLPSNTFKISAAMTVVQQTPNQYDDNYSPRSPQPSEP